MSIKIEIPEISREYRGAMIEYFMGMDKKERGDFYRHLNVISGYTQDVDVSMSMGGMGGCKTIEEYKNSSIGMERATIEEYIRFLEIGYSGGDFQHIFFEAYMCIRVDMLMVGE